MLRDGALSDSAVITLANDKFIPVWINIREDPFPKARALSAYEWDLFLTTDRQVMNLYYLGFFIRTYIISPDLQTLLNEDDGLWGQITMSTAPYLDMMLASLHRWQDMAAKATHGGT